MMSFDTFIERPDHPDANDNGELAVTVEYGFDPADPDVGIMSPTIIDMTVMHGKQEIVLTKQEEQQIEEECWTDMEDAKDSADAERADAWHADRDANDYFDRD